MDTCLDESTSVTTGSPPHLDKYKKSESDILLKRISSYTGYINPNMYCISSFTYAKSSNLVCTVDVGENIPHKSEETMFDTASIR